VSETARETCIACWEVVCQQANSFKASEHALAQIPSHVGVIYGQECTLNMYEQKLNRPTSIDTRLSYSVSGSVVIHIPIHPHDL